MIYGFMGKVGAGKTSGMILNRHSIFSSGKTLYTNMAIYDLKGRIQPWDPVGAFLYHCGFRVGRKMIPYSNYRHYVNKEDINKIPKGSTIILDECHIYFDSKEKTFLNIDTRKKITDSRRDGIDIYWATQRFKAVSTDLRDNTHFYIFVNSWWVIPRFLRVYKFSWFNDVDESGTEGKNPLGNKWQFVSLRTLQQYDTLQSLEPADLKERVL